MNARFVFLGFAALCAALTACSGKTASRGETAPEVVRLQGFDHEGADYTSKTYFRFDGQGRVVSCNVYEGESSIFSIDWEFKNFYSYFGEGSFETNAAGFIKRVKVKDYEGRGTNTAIFTYDDYGRLLSWRISGSMGKSGVQFKRDAEGRIYGVAGSGERMHSVRDYLSYGDPNRHGQCTYAEADFMFGMDAWGEVIPAMFQAGLLGFPAQYLLSGVGSEENYFTFSTDSLITSEIVVGRPQLRYHYANDFTLTDGYVGQVFTTTSGLGQPSIKEEYE